MKICLDPGHFGSDYNPGVAAGYVESNFTWDYYWLMKERLEKYGVEVIGTRATKDDYPKNSKGEDALQVRGRTAAGCDLFISIHSNATGDAKNPRPEINSVFTHWSVRTGEEKLAKVIGNTLTDFFRKEWGDCQNPTMYAEESKKYPGYDYFGVLKGSASVGVPGIIVEHSFHTNPRYCEWAMVPGNIERMADIEVDAIATYYGLKKQEPLYYIYLDTDLKRGDKGDKVKEFQMRMCQLSQDFNDSMMKASYKDGQFDGSFGGGSEKIVKKFQELSGLPVTGALDKQTREVLNTPVWEYLDQIKTNTQKYEKELAQQEEQIHQLENKVDSAITILSEE